MTRAANGRRPTTRRGRQAQATRRRTIRGARAAGGLQATRVTANGAGTVVGNRGRRVSGTEGVRIGRRTLADVATAASRAGRNSGRANRRASAARYRAKMKAAGIKRTG